MMYPWLDYKGLTYFSKKLRDKLKTAFNNVYDKITDIYNEINGVNSSIKEINNTLGDTDISEIDSGTLTGAVSEFNSALATTPHYVGELSTSTNLNELFMTGIYEGSNGNVPQNAPDEAVATSSIIVTVYNENSLGNNFTIQEYTQVVSGELQKYMRRYSGSAWNDWDSYAKNSALTDKADKSSLTDGSVTKVGTSTVGSGTKPVYLNSGTVTASSSTVGSTDTPVYLNNGTLTACGFQRYSTTNSSTITFISCGYLTSSRTALHFAIPIGTALYGTISDISCDNVVIRQNGNYGFGGSDGSGYHGSNFSFSQNRYETNITITDTFADYSFTNNDCVSVNAKLCISY